MKRFNVFLDLAVRNVREATNRLGVMDGQDDRDFEDDVVEVLNQIASRLGVAVRITKPFITLHGDLIYAGNGMGMSMAIDFVTKCGQFEAD